MKPLFVTYEQFGAKGDGVADDFEAIVACHEFANENGIPVKACDGATYYLSGKAIHAVIKTDVDFGKAKFIIDDVAVENRRSPIFTVESDYTSYPVEIKSLKKTDKKVDFPHEGKVIVTVMNKNRTIFIREGLNQDNGVGMHELFIVDEAGNIESTLNWDYAEITSATARRVDDEPITIKGGIFTTIANQEESFYNYYSRNMSISRSNVTVTGLAHYVEGELDHGAPYSAFLSFGGNYNVTIKDVLLTPRFTYWTASKIPGQDVPMGSYDLGGSNAIKVSLIGIRQSRDIMDQRYWGLIGSNYCKEFYLEDCIMSRFDAHHGATDVTIKNSSFGHQCLSLIGHGFCHIENTSVYGRAFIYLREDYGCHWDGKITVKNCSWSPISPDTDTAVVFGKNRGQHDFGFDAMMPETVEIDGLEICDEGATNNEKLAVLSAYTDIEGEETPYAYRPTQRLIAKNISCRSGREIVLCEDPKLYPDLKIEN